MATSTKCVAPSVKKKSLEILTGNFPDMLTQREEGIVSLWICDQKTQR